MTQEESMGGALALPNDNEVLMSLIQKASTDDGFSVEKLSQLLDVKERWDNEQARKAYVLAMAEFKANPPEILKSQQVAYGSTHYKHASLGEATCAVAAGLSVFNMSHQWSVEQYDGRVAVTCTITHGMGHRESVTITAPPDDSPGNMNAIQRIGSCVAYLERYTLMAITGLAAKEMDDDGNAYGRTSVARPAPAPSKETCAQSGQHDPWAEWAETVTAWSADEFNFELDAIADGPRAQKIALVKEGKVRKVGFDRDTMRFVGPEPSDGDEA